MGDNQLDAIKLPPHSVEAEQSVLGGLLLENSAWERIADLITEQDFYRHDHRLVYRHITRLLDASKPADVVTVSESLESSKELTAIGGLAYLGALAQNTPSAANIRRYAEIVRDRAILRGLVEVGTSIADSAYSPMGRSASDLLDQAEDRFPALTQPRQRKSDEDREQQDLEDFALGERADEGPGDDVQEVVRRAELPRAGGESGDAAGVEL